MHVAGLWGPGLTDKVPLKGVRSGEGWTASVAAISRCHSNHKAWKTIVR